MTCRLAAMLLTAATLTVGAGPACATHLSSLELRNLAQVGTQWEVSLRLRIGAGVTGADRGANQDTREFALVAWGGAGIDIVDFSPATVTGSVTQVTYTGFDIGSSGDPIFLGYDPVFAPQAVTTASLFFGDANGFPVDPIACVLSTALCGEVHQEVFDFLIRYSELPVGIRAFGIEGAGDLLSGATPNRDMMIDFAPFRAVPTPGSLALLICALLACAAAGRGQGRGSRRRQSALSPAPAATTPGTPPRAPG